VPSGWQRQTPEAGPEGQARHRQIRSEDNPYLRYVYVGWEMVIKIKTDMRIEKKENGKRSILMALRLTSRNVTPNQCAHLCPRWLAKDLLPGCLGANDNQPINEFRRIVDRARHLPSTAFDKTRGGVETGKLQQNADKRSATTLSRINRLATC
jgi:hypothetical protein